MIIPKPDETYSVTYQPMVVGYSEVCSEDIIPFEVNGSIGK
ncbi:hypothetical protein [Labrys miyagiensis]|nr:hypothetical protein [Labrys miyagiensis]